MTTATVSIPYTEFQAIKEARSKAESEIVRLQKQITDEKVAASDHGMLMVARAALDVARFAVANLPPESTLDWPFESLRLIAKCLPAMPDVSPDDAELAVTLDHFATECERFETRRRVLGTARLQ